MEFAGNTGIIFTDNFVKTLADLDLHKQYSSVFYLCDAHTAECLATAQFRPEESSLIVLNAGEQFKNLDSCQKIWSRLLAQQADRRALLVNIGGGMITDLGGFAASVYKRGIDFIHVPTSLMGMTDASIGGKTAINAGFYKNVIGTFAKPEKVIICPQFLASLPDSEFKSAFSEIFKHALINDTALFHRLESEGFPATDNAQGWLDLLQQNIRIKLNITEADPTEQGLRQLLNFGHTLGHAIESYSQQTGSPLLHGYAVMAGLYAETWLSVRKGLLGTGQAERIYRILEPYIPEMNYGRNDIPEILMYALNDKKNRGSSLVCTLLRDIGLADYRYEIETAEAEAALMFLFSSLRS